jgi:hypothetical protein
LPVIIFFFVIVGILYIKYFQAHSSGVLSVVCYQPKGKIRQKKDYDKFCGGIVPIFDGFSVSDNQ